MIKDTNMLTTKLDVVAQTCNPSTQEAEAGGLRFEVSLGYIVRPCLKNIK
jgi:hypothetical protein